jgi:hypothetical protein
MNHDKRAEDLGELIAKRMNEENPDLIRNLQKLVNDKLKLYQKPFYVRIYEKVKDIVYR